MLITPYYNRVGPGELAGLARAVHGAAGGLPLIAYTMPAMAGSQWPLDVVQTLAAEGIVSGVKESGEEVGRFLQLLDTCPPGSRPSADPHAALPRDAGRRPRRHPRDRERVPERCVAVYQAAAAGEGGRAAELFAPLVPLLGAIRAAGPSPDGHARGRSDPLRRRHGDTQAARAGRSTTGRASGGLALEAPAALPARAGPGGLSR